MVKQERKVSVCKICRINIIYPAGICPPAFCGECQDKRPYPYAIYCLHQKVAAGFPLDIEDCMVGPNRTTEPNPENMVDKPWHEYKELERLQALAITNELDPSLLDTLRYNQAGNELSPAAENMWT